MDTDTSFDFMPLRIDQHAIHFLIQTVTEIADRDRADIGTVQPP